MTDNKKINELKERFNNIIENLENMERIFGDGLEDEDGFEYEVDFLSNNLEQNIFDIERELDPKKIVDEIWNAYFNEDTYCLEDEQTYKDLWCDKLKNRITPQEMCAVVDAYKDVCDNPDCYNDIFKTNVLVLFGSNRDFYAEKKLF